MIEYERKALQGVPDYRAAELLPKRSEYCLLIPVINEGARILTELGRAQTAQRWYEGPRGPKSLSTKTASGNLCSTCGFFVALQGDLSEMFGVCANKWSPDDGKVVSLDHGCGEHSEIEPPEPSHMWIQSKPAFDDLHIDVIAQAPRDERGEVELIEKLGVAGLPFDVPKGTIILKSQLPETR